MNFWTEIAFTVLLKVLKDRKESKKYEAAIFKVHAAIERMFPQLQPGERVSMLEGK